MKKRYVIAALVVALGVPGGYFAWWLGSPLLFDTTVDEEFPFAVNAVLPEGTTIEEVENQLAAAATVDTTVREEMPDSLVSDVSDLGASDVAISGGAVKATATVPLVDPTPGSALTAESTPGQPSPTPLTVASPTPTAAAFESPDEDPSNDAPTATVAPPSPTATATPPTPVPTQTAVPEAVAVILKLGAFRDADRFHKGSGSATIYRGPDGSLLLRLEDFRVTNGPELHVIVTPNSDPMTSGQVKTAGYLDLGLLKGNVGDQNYFLPDDFDVGLLGSVVIYCAPFNIIFSVAPLADAPL